MPGANLDCSAQSIGSSGTFAREDAFMRSLTSRSENFDRNSYDDKTGGVKDDPLREDIRLLGRMLGDTLREQEGEPTFDLVENIRQTAIRFRREQDPKARHELDMILNQLSNKDTVAVRARIQPFLATLQHS